VPHDSSNTRPERRKAPAGSTVRVNGLRVSRAAWARVESLAEQLVRAGIPRAHRSGALDLLLLHPEVAGQVLIGGCRVYRCATCSTWLADARQSMAHQDGHPEHEVRGYLVPPGTHGSSSD
jgi:ferredoxin